MKDSNIDKIYALLPELYPLPKGQPTPPKTCTPESGCAPAAAGSQANLLNVLTGLKPGPPVHNLQQALSP